MSGRLEGRSVLVTGSTGIGAETARLAAREHARVHVVSRTADHAEALADELTRAGAPASWTAADLRIETEVESAFAAAVRSMGRVDGVLSVAGGSGRRFGDGPIDRVTGEAFDRTIELNLRSQALVAGAAVRAMRAAGGGSLVLVSSVLASDPVPVLFETHAYAAAKAGIVGLATAMAASYAGEGIRVNVVAPGLTETPMSRRAAADPDTVAFAARKQPLAGGFVSARDVAAAVIYLLSDDARAVTGQVLAVDGGWSVVAAEPRGESRR